MRVFPDWAAAVRSRIHDLWDWRKTCPFSNWFTTAAEKYVDQPVSRARDTYWGEIDADKQ